MSTEGEFHVDLYTLPDNLIKMLWDFVQDKGVVWVGSRSTREKSQKHPKN